MSMGAALNRLSKQTLIMLLGAILGAANCMSAQAEPPTEYEVKAAYIHNTAKFVEWPAASTGFAGSLKLCVLGQDPFGNALNVLRGKAIHDKVWEVVHANSDTNLRECGALFIAASERRNLRQILDATKDSPVLTMGDSDGYAQQGVMVNFYLQDNMVRIEINTDAVKRSGLNIGSQLLKLARIVQEHGGGK